MKTLAGQSLERLEDAQELVQRDTEAFYDLVLDLMGLDNDSTIPTLETPLYPRNVENPLDVWTRPAEQFRYAKSQGASDHEAMDKAVERVNHLASDDLMLTRRKASSDIIKKTPKVTGYRRVIRPEMSQTGTCGLCLAASTRVYTTKNLLPMHNNCKCGILPITKGNDPGRLFNEEDLQQLYDLAGGNTAADLAGVKYKIDEHGEFGPYLVRKNKKNPKATKAKPMPSNLSDDEKRRKSLEAQLKTYAVTIPQLEQDVKTDPSKLPALEWQKKRVAKIKKELANG